MVSIAALSLHAPTRPIEPQVPLFFSTWTNALARNCEPRSDCRLVPSMSRWPITLRAAATAREAFILGSIEYPTILFE